MRTNPYPIRAALTAALPLLCLLFAGGPASAFSPTGYPGAVWMLSGRDTSGIEGTNTQGIVRQGIELLRFGGGESVQVYGQYNWRFRTLNADYYNSHTPYVGAMFSSKYGDIGAEFGWPHYTAKPVSNKQYDVFVSFFRYWTLASPPKGALLKELPFSVWGNASYDLLNKDGASTLGWAKLEAHLLWLPGNWMAGPFASYNWRFRTRNADYFDMNGLCAGLRIGNGDVEIGTQYAWRQYPRLDEGSRGLEFFINIYKAWDLKKRR